MRRTLLIFVALGVAVARWPACAAEGAKKGVERVSYAFRYSVEERSGGGVGVVLQHWERRTQDLVFGSYSLADADGRVRIVTYEVNGPSGFRAVVTYRTPEEYRLPKGHLAYPESYLSPIQHAEPVSFITEELFHKRKSYPNLSV